ncbi:MAG: DUF3052 domain-containing protein [Bacteroidia bacterium]|nr:DUF3052 domain-containing protein [Bacteroidia bacterium]
MAGYSATPLVKKLGIKTNFTMLIHGQAVNYFAMLAPTPKGIEVLRSPAKKEVDFIHLFVKNKREFEKGFIKLKKCLRKEGMFWVSWPKKASRVPTDLDENIIREFGLINGLVDVKVCAVDEVWSGLKFVYRVKDR